MHVSQLLITIFVACSLLVAFFDVFYLLPLLTCSEIILIIFKAYGYSTSIVIMAQIILTDSASIYSFMLMKYVFIMHEMKISLK